MRLRLPDMSTIRFVVVYGEIKVIRKSHETPKGVKDISGTFYQNGRVFSGYDSTRTYRTQHVTSSKSKALRIAQEQSDSQLEHLRLESDEVYKKSQRITLCSYLNSK